MKAHWSIENDGSIVLRESRNKGPLGIVGPVKPTTALYEAGERGFTAIILRPGMPSAGPWVQRRQAAEWLVAWISAHWIPDLEATDIPIMGGPREVAREKARRAEAHL